MHAVLSDAQVGSGNRPWVAFRTDLLHVSACAEGHCFESTA